MKKINLIACLLFIACFACTDKSETKEDLSPGEVSEQGVNTTNKNEIQLNGGQKWRVDAEILIYIQAMEKDIQIYSEDQNAHVLSDSLQTRIKKLISSCTMSGQSHDELHKWLLPFMAHADSLKKNADVKSIEELEKGLHVFHDYFE